MIHFELDNGELTLENNPGIADVTKQLLYEYSFMEQFKSVYKYWYNILVFPTPMTIDVNATDIVFGSTKLDLGIFSEKKIWLMYLNPKEIFTTFLIDNSNSKNRLNSILNDSTIIPNKV